MAISGSSRFALRDAIAVLRARFSQARGSSLGFVTLTTALVGTLLASALIVGTPVTGGVVDLLSGRSWLTRSDTGQVMLANGASARVDLRLDVEGVGGHDLEVVQVGEQFLLIDRTTGEVRSLDMAELQVGEAHVLGDPDGLDVVAADDELIVVHRRTGIVEVQEPATGEVLDSTDVGGNLTRAVIDSEGQIWVADTDASAVVPLSLDGGELHQGRSISVDSGRGATLALVDDRPVVVDAARKALIRVDDGGAHDPVPLPLEDDESTEVTRVTTGDLAALSVNRTGALIMVDGARAQRVDLGQAGHELGEPVVFERRVFVPDFSAGELLVLDPNGQPAGTGIRLGNAEPGWFSVRVEGGRLWVDDPDSDDAFVLGPNDTSFRRIDKGSGDVPSNDEKPEVLEPPERRDTPAAEKPPTPPPSNQQPADVPPSTPPGAPGAPPSVTAVAGDAQVSLSWAQAPPNGAPITTYQLAWRATGAASSGKRTVSGSQRQVTVGNLRNGTTYTFSVRATNRIGTGPAATSDPVTPDGNVPDPPEGVSATAGGDGTVTVTWDAADPNGTSPVRSYTVTAVDEAGATVTAATDVTRTLATVSTSSGLAVGATYRFTISALNARGNTSEQSRPSDAVTLVDVAEAPPNPTATPGDRTLAIAWEEPALNGGVLDHYEVTGDNGAGSQTVTGRQATFTGLQNSVTYTFQVRAVTEANGETLTGTASTITGTPGRAPEAYQMSVTAQGTNVSWSVRVNGHQSGPASCEVFSNGGVIWSGPCSSTISGSFNGAHSTTYTMYARAMNSYGTGQSNTAAARTADPPPPPPQISLTRGGAAPAGSWYSVTLSGFTPGSQVTVTCRDSVDPQGFWTQTFTIDGAGNAADATLCYSNDGPDHWVTGGGVESNHVAW